MGFFSNHGTLANPRYLGVYTMNPQKQQGFGPPKNQVTLKTIQTCRLRDRLIIFRLLAAGNSCLRTLGAGRTNRTVPCTMWAPSLVISGVITPLGTVISPQLPMYKAIHRCQINSLMNDRLRAHLAGFFGRISPWISLVFFSDNISQTKREMLWEFTIGKKTEKVPTNFRI